MIRVLIADDQTLIRSTLGLLVNSAADVTVVGEAASGRQAVTLARQTRADVVVMDIRMPDGDGIEATRQIAADDDLAGVRILILTTFETDENVAAALRAGASGFLAKDADPATLLTAIRVVAAGESLLSPAATTTLVARFLQRPDVPEKHHLNQLTQREEKVLRLIAHGLTNHEIAEELVLSPLTAKTYVSRLITKLGVRDRVQLVITAYEAGLVRAGERS